ncbi:carbohydrate porin [Vibrio sp. ZSDZ34]|uniref:Carbohydrate porin n=1 Tax=Vibrio gelatinilyticus TaxID=2893468 RepID=A0A9X1W9T4_9VIBR|nr:carbohydrate porin [Vibrio gelatinilyticus]MCJ2376294.1 carbohydrate porin [Vibrio gelatinilyticus]
MKLSKLSLACLVAAGGLSLSPVAMSEENTQGFEFHGYFRAGALYSSNDDFKRSKFPATKEKLGRLGIESDNHFELALQKNFDTADGQSIRIKSRLGADNAQSGGKNQLSTSADAANGSVGLVETFVEFDGITETGTVWGGKRFYGKDNYIFMTDFFYTDMSGTGVGVEGIELGGNKWDFAYVASDDAEGGFWGQDTNNPMHSVHVGVNFGSLELHAMGKYLPDNFVDVDGTMTQFADTGAELTAIYHSDSVFGLSEKGFTKYIAQAGQGLGSGQLLGGTLTTYNAWKPGYGGAMGPSNMKKIDSGDKSARALIWGGYFFESGVSIFHAIQGQYNDLEKRGKDSWASAMIRPTFPLAKNWALATEAGYQYGDYSDEAGNGGSGYDYKLTVAPTLSINTGFGPAPEIRFLATYLDGSARDKADLLVGIQADMWW